MRAAVFQGIGIGHKIETLPDPVPGGDGELVIRVERSGICASDLTMTAQRAVPTPLDPMFEIVCKPGTILGHEFGGEVVEVGRGVRDVRVGDRVAPSAFSGCGKCLRCLTGKMDWCGEVRAMMGGYAEYAVANQQSCFKLPQELCADDSALLEPMATSLHSVTLAKLTPNSRVAVVGAGPIGLGIAYFARRCGIRRLAMIARSDRNRALALEMGVDGFFTQGSEVERQLLGHLDGRPDVIFEASGARGVFDQAIQWLERAGTLVVSSFNPMPDPVVHGFAMLKEIRVQYVSSYVSEDLKILAELFGRSATPLRRMITRRVSLDEFPQAFESLRTDNPHCKVMLSP